eukprot:scaffold1196_cov118-Alexandrium_tamarense.AAC.2
MRQSFGLEDASGFSEDVVDLVAVADTFLFVVGCGGGLTLSSVSYFDVAVVQFRLIDNILFISEDITTQYFYDEPLLTASVDERVFANLGGEVHAYPRLPVVRFWLAFAER